jgi:hypothetical protein
MEQNLLDKLARTPYSGHLIPLKLACSIALQAMHCLFVQL